MLSKLHKIEIHKQYLILFTLIIFVFASCKKESFISIENGQFIKNGLPYYFIGTNYWYGTSLAADTTGGNRQRLIKELDFLKENRKRKRS